MKKFNIIVAVLILTTMVLGIVFLLKDDKKLDVDIIKIDGDYIKIAEHDEITYFDDELTFNGKTSINELIINGNITIGDTLEDVLETFDIKDDYAILNVEVANEEQDGTTNVLENSYKKEDLEKDYLDAYIMFGYIYENNEWVLLKSNELDNKDALIYQIGFDDKENDYKITSIGIKYKVDNME